MDKNLIIALSVGILGFLCILSLTFLFEGFNNLIYVLSILFLLGYAILLKAFLQKKQIIKKNVEEDKVVIQPPLIVNSPVKPINLVNPVNVIEKPISRPGPLILPVRVIEKDNIKKVNLLDPALDNYIKKSLSNNKSKDFIISELLKAGWDKDSVNISFERVSNIKMENMNKSQLSSANQIIREKIKEKNDLPELKTNPNKVIPTRPLRRHEIKLLRLKQK